MIDERTLIDGIKGYLTNLIEKGEDKVDILEFNVDIQNLIKELAQHGQREFGRDSLGRCKMRGCNLCDARKEQLKKRWIPIGQFPEEPCLLCFEDETMAVGYYDETGDVCISVGDNFYCSSKDPVAWQPLPEAYKE